MRFAPAVHRFMCALILPRTDTRTVRKLKTIHHAPPSALNPRIMPLPPYIQLFFINDDRAMSFRATHAGQRNEHAYLNAPQKSTPVLQFLVTVQVRSHLRELNG